MSTGTSRPGTHAPRAVTALRAGRAGGETGFDGMQPLVRVIKALTSGDSRMDSFSAALGLLRWHALLATITSSRRPCLPTARLSTLYARALVTQSQAATRPNLEAGATREQLA